MSIRPLTSWFLMSLFLAVACVLPGRADDPAPAPPPETPPQTPEPPAAQRIFVLDLAETLEGKDSGYNYPVFFARKLLEQVGVKTHSLKPTRWDKDKKPKGPTTPKAGDDFFEGEGDKPKDPPKDPEEKPAPKGDLTIKGVSATKLKDRAEFYDKVLAYTFASTAKFELLGPDGKKRATIEVSDAYGLASLEREDVARHCLERMGRKILLAVFRHEAVRALLDKAQLADVDKVLAGVQEHIDKQDRKKPRDGETPPPPEDGNDQKG